MSDLSWYWDWSVILKDVLVLNGGLYRDILKSKIIILKNKGFILKYLNIKRNCRIVDGNLKKLK